MTPLIKPYLMSPILISLLPKMLKILLRLSVLIAFLATWVHPIADAQEAQSLLEAQRALRKDFQSLELFTSRQGSWIFPLALPPRVVWRDAETARNFGFAPGFVVRWFDSNLEEAELPNRGGRSFGRCHPPIA